MKAGHTSLFLSFVMGFLFLPGFSSAQEEQALQQKTQSSIVFSGYFSREENDGKMARLSGKSHYMKFYAPNRVIRLFIPYPYSTSVKPETISKVFQEVNKMSLGDAYIRGKFGYLEQEVIANIGKVKSNPSSILFDCDATAPCRIEFMENALKLIKKGILADHVIMFDYVDM